MVDPRSGALEAGHLPHVGSKSYRHFTFRKGENAEMTSRHSESQFVLEGRLLKQFILSMHIDVTDTGCFPPALVMMF